MPKCACVCAGVLQCVEYRRTLHESLSASILFEVMHVTQCFRNSREPFVSLPASGGKKKTEQKNNDRSRTVYRHLVDLSHRRADSSLSIFNLFMDGGSDENCGKQKDACRDEEEVEVLGVHRSGLH